MSEKEVVIVTGSSGLIGSALIENLAGHFALAGFDKVTLRLPPPAAECVCIDLTSEDAVNSAFERVRIAYGTHIASVIHLAAYYDLTGEPSPLYEHITVRGTERLLRHLKHFIVEQFVFTSTMLVHAGAKPGQSINEGSLLDPTLPYPESKILTERLIEEQHGSIPAVILRLAGVYDDVGRLAFLAHQIAGIYERRFDSFVYPGNLATGQSALHLDDLTNALRLVIDRRKELPPHSVLLLGEPEAFSFDEIQRTVGKLIHNEEWKTRQIPKLLARTGAWVQDEFLQEDSFIRPWMVDNADAHYQLDISRARDLLGWERKHSLRDTLPKIVAALRSNPPSWYRANKLNPALVAADRMSADEHQAMDPVAHHEMMREHAKHVRRMHFDMLWVHFLNILLGAWLATTPFVFGMFGQNTFSDAVLHVTQERGLWDPILRNTALIWSDLASGLLIMLLGALSLSPRLSCAEWANTLVGIWLLFAPLVFWSPSAAVYANDTLVGALVIAFSILVPMMPGMSPEGMMDQSDVPIGWTYCPSTYLQRLPIIALGALGFLIARSLAAYQMGHIDHVIDPFFNGQGGLNGTETIITSNVSKAWPIPDGGLGAVTYLFEILMGAMGDRRRWRTMPWMVTMFIFVVVPLGIVSIYFIIIQPIVIGTYCSLCLLAALAMVIMIPYALDELVATGQYLVQSRRRGQSLLRTFFRGGPSSGSKQDEKPYFGAAWPDMVASAVRGVTASWRLVASALIGVWLMFTRLVFGTAPPLAFSDHLVGALAITIAVIAMAEVGRPLRFIILLFGAWLIVAPWLLSGGSVVAGVGGVVTGIALIALSLPRGQRSHEQYGSWDRFVV